MKPGVLSHARAIVLPLAAAVAVPAALLSLTHDLDGVWGWAPAFAPAQLAAGAVLIVLGLLLLFSTVRLFAAVGEGTLAPWEPPRRLVVRGPYRYVRNPMISGVLIVLLGEAVLFGSLAVLAWCVFFFSGNSMYFRAFEEPALVNRFGDDYVAYRQNVPGWLPRLKPWRGPGNEKDR